MPCAGGIVVDGRGRLLLIRRGNPPARGSWSVPGGRVEPGESAPDACVREVQEETGLDVEVVRHVGRVERDGLAGELFVIDDYLCTVRGGTVRAATDATEARWVDGPAYAALDRAGALAPRLTEALAGWGVLPAGADSLPPGDDCSPPHGDSQLPGDDGLAPRGDPAGPA